MFRPFFIKKLKRNENSELKLKNKKSIFTIAAGRRLTVRAVYPSVRCRDWLRHAVSIAVYKTWWDQRCHHRLQNGMRRLTPTMGEEEEETSSLVAAVWCDFPYMADDCRLMRLGLRVDDNVHHHLPPSQSPPPRQPSSSYASTTIAQGM